MPQKDHLTTKEEVQKLQRRDIKKITAISYQGAPPAITGQLTSTGESNKTPTQIKNVAFPVLLPIDDESENIAASLDVDLGLEEAHYHQIQISDDGGGVTNLTINFVNLPKNRAINFFLDFIKDPGNVSTPTITFNPTLENLPSGFADTEDRYLLEVLAKDSPVEERYEVVNSQGGGGGTDNPTWKSPVRVTPDGFNFFFPYTQETVDGITVVPGDRILQKDELNPVFNGIWEVQAPLIPGVPNLYLLARPSDFVAFTPALSETFVAVEEGTANEKKLFHLTSVNPMTVDVDGQVWEEFGGGAAQDPIIVNENNLGNVSFISVNVDWSVANFHRMVVEGDIQVVFNGLPPVGKWEEIVVQFTQDAIGGHNVTFVNAFENLVIPVVNTGANSITTIAFYAYNTGSNVILAFNTLSNFTGAALPSFLHATKTTNQVPPLNVGSPATFDTLVNASTLTIDPAGRISGLEAGHIYECECFMAITNAGNINACVNFQFYDVANAVTIGSRGDAILTGQLATNSAQPSAKAIFTATSDTDTLEVHFVFNNDLVNTFMYGLGILGTPQSYVLVKDITNAVGAGGSTVNYPDVLITDVLTLSPGATVNLDLSLHQHFVLNLTQNTQITFTNVPSNNDESEQIILELIQDNVGGWTVSYTDTIEPVNPPVIVTTPFAREVLTGFVRRTTIGTYVYNLYVVG